MKPCCEFITSEILPGVRALIAKKMIEDHNITQSKAAQLLDTTQPAISHYKRDLRGRKFDVFKKNPEILKMIDNLALRIMNGEIPPEKVSSHLCEVCRYMKNNGLIPEGYQAD